MSTKLKEKIITNLSNYQLTPEETATLQNGLDYIHPPTKFDDKTFISNIETYFVNILGHATDKRDYEEREENEKITYNLTPKQLAGANEIRTTCNNFRRAAIKEIRINQQSTNKIRQVLKNLSQNRNIVITRPDKGRGIVILNKHDYIKKLTTILSDNTTFKEIDEDPTIKQENRLNTKLLELKNSELITLQEYKYARSTGSQPAQIYGLPKIHKKPDPDGILPIRPILSSSKTFNFRLAKLLANKLNKLRENPNIIKDSFTFVDWLHKLEIDTSKYKMLSFDITSLFTKVPIDRTIEIILDKLYESKHTCIVSKDPKYKWCKKCIQRREMQTLLEMATKETHFIFNDKIYRQCDGVAMGSPLGPVFADIYVNYLETKFLKRIKTNGVVQYKRFVDDTFTLVHKDTDKYTILNILNSYDDQIQFTCEEEKDQTISFLDVKVKRLEAQEKPFVTNVYRKETFTGLILQWSSYVPKNYKVSTLSSMIYRAIKICSNFKLMTEEFDNIRKIAADNGYPINFIEAQIRRTLDRYYNQKQNNNKPRSTTKKEEKKNELICVDLPYHEKSTEKLGKKLIQIAASLQPQLQIQPIQRPPPAISTFFSTKDKINTTLQSGVVYEISCRDCPSKYIGKTIRQVQRRLIEHGQPSDTTNNRETTTQTLSNLEQLHTRPKRTNKPIVRYGIDPTPINQQTISDTIEEKTNINHSALMKHAHEYQHQINWKETKILDKDTKPYRLLVRESLLIKQFQPILNRTVNSVPLIVFPEGIPTKKPTVKIKYISDNNNNPTEGHRDK
ncbi:unnamed protein product [Rotaria magnacalcarata]|uniref:Reverse transcriptase domain-containing protein n=1 Tax=Rotaria magnacalcarata TaxID=392030 RepID=A0A816LJN7_9BILA|nr:unnamed protein product [Rotaria magnacalcarata]CAF4215832.1 unnamed protein product [Rotaria magnacalcarata]